MYVQLAAWFVAGPPSQPLLCLGLFPLLLVQYFSAALCGRCPSAAASVWCLHLLLCALRGSVRLPCCCFCWRTSSGSLLCALSVLCLPCGICRTWYALRCVPGSGCSGMSMCLRPCLVRLAFPQAFGLVLSRLLPATFLGLACPAGVCMRVPCMCMCSCVSVGGGWSLA